GGATRGESARARNPQRRARKLERLQFLFEELLSMQVGIETVFAQKLLVRAALDDTAVLQHEDQIGIHHGRNPMADDDNRASAVMLPQVGKNGCLRIRVDGRKRIIQNKDAWKADECARDRGSLLLAARK